MAMGAWRDFDLVQHFNNIAEHAIAQKVPQGWRGGSIRRRVRKFLALERRFFYPIGFSDSRQGFPIRFLCCDSEAAFRIGDFGRGDDAANQCCARVE
jgi:hypothetical protein